MSRTVVQITSDADFVAFCRAPLFPSRLEFKVNRITLPPTGVTLRGARDIEIAGETAPNGRLLITGGRFAINACNNVTLSKIGFRLQRLKSPLPQGVFETYERSWKPLAIHADSPEQPSRNIRLTQCSFSGMTDELEVGPSDHATWFARWMGRPAAVGITFDRCIFGPSLVNTGETINDAAKRALFLTERRFHNMSLSASCVQSVAFVGCVFVGANRRSPQIGGKQVGLAHCVVDDWGSMAFGLHAGSDGEINACHFLRGPHTSPLKRAAGLVEGTESSPFAILGQAMLSITDNTCEYNAVGGVVRKGWKICHTAESAWLKRGTVTSPLPLRTVADIVTKAGCGDSLDAAIRARLTRMQHVPWIENYTTEFAFPKG